MRPLSNVASWLVDAYTLRVKPNYMKYACCCFFYNYVGVHVIKTGHYIIIHVRFAQAHDV